MFNGIERGASLVEERNYLTVESDKTVRVDVVGSGTLDT